MLITQCGERRDLCLTIGYPLLIANSGTLMFLRVGIPVSLDQLELRNPGLILLIERVDPVQTLFRGGRTSSGLIATDLIWVRGGAFRQGCL